MQQRPDAISGLNQCAAVMAAKMAGHGSNIQIKMGLKHFDCCEATNTIKMFGFAHFPNVSFVAL